VTVNEEQIAHAIMTLLEQEKTLAEGAGAVGFAALRYQQIKQIKGKKVVVIISGGNIDMTMLARILERGLESDGRLARIRVIMPDKPGNIAVLSALIAEHHANILEISQNRSVSEVELGETEVELQLEARGRKHINAITDAIRKQGYHVK
jgi:threonine dehydratase